MADEQTVKLTYHGPPVTVVEVEGELTNGDEIEVDEGLASRLLCVSGFDGPDELKPPEPLDPPPPSGQQISELEEEIRANQEAAGEAPAPDADETPTEVETAAGEGSSETFGSERESADESTAGKGRKR